ncbi:MAG: hypothetical protein JHC34_05130, partial [Acidobacteria bacterium]|nr:hypothetical protein [Acidobacteriota bacterium]
MVDEALAEELLWILQSSGDGFAEVFLQKAKSATASSEPSGEMALSSASDDGLSLYLEREGKSFFSALGPSSAGAILAEARRLAEGKPGAEGAPRHATGSSARASDPSLEESVEKTFGKWDVKSALAAAREGALSADPRVVGALAICKEAVSSAFRLDSEGGRTRRVEHTWTVYVKALAGDGGEARSGARIFGETAQPSNESVAGLAAEAARAACLLLEARPAPVGELPVVLSPQAAGLFLHETLGRALEG